MPKLDPRENFYLYGIIENRNMCRKEGNDLKSVWLSNEL